MGFDNLMVAANGDYLVCHKADGSMPIGNGEVGLNVWAEPDGDLLFYISRTDSWSECNRLLKLGRVRVHLSPNPFATGQAFRQELKLRDGQIVITAGDATLRVFVDAAAPVIYVCGTSKTPRTVTATYETWRTSRRVLNGLELSSSWTMQAAPESIEVAESADHCINAANGGVLVWHRNESSIVPLTLKHQGLASLAAIADDPLLHRTFGAAMIGEDFIPAGTNTLQTAQPVKQFELSIATHTAQTATIGEWQERIPSIVKADEAAARTTEWWNEPELDFRRGKTITQTGKSSYAATWRGFRWRQPLSWRVRQCRRRAARAVGRRDCKTIGGKTGNQNHGSTGGHFTGERFHGGGVDQARTGRKRTNL